MAGRLILHRVLVPRRPRRVRLTLGEVDTNENFYMPGCPDAFTKTDDLVDVSMVRDVNNESCTGDNKTPVYVERGFI